MNKIYTLSSALTLNATGQKVDAVASPARPGDLSESRHDFVFNFFALRKKYTVYKLQVAGKSGIQGLVAFTPTQGALECANMEVCASNKRGKPAYQGVGKAMVALCCKVSADNGLDGCIYFDAKNRLIPYYQRLGATHLFGLRMIIETTNAMKLIDLYF
ncbi:MAG: hypothetical protein BGO21_06430 [Dyadobacter sp. 50-39]|uniref:GNAT family N-acetyltransferase n=1 Tax=Dyadobacter sp. 50-39 TaxID=1895756 RepID=UPI0009627963|nr:GNAT family N-acetyltransferase [Dyadobacter sp. 50-39]OJV12378.1 MAG: hypothetical protein BGO21_06430 [Dyadobacter sp. 50-39]